MQYYVELAGNNPNWFHFKIISESFSLFDTTYAYLKTHYCTDPTDKIELTSHALRVRTKSRVTMDNVSAFVNVVDSLCKSKCCESHGPVKYSEKTYRGNNGIWSLASMNVYFKNIYCLTEGMRTIDSLDWFVIEDVTIRNDYQIGFWVEMEFLNKSRMQKIVDDIKKASIPFLKIEYLE